ncbi:MAG TPA: hypothetical protein PLM24_05055 [Methanothrix sp.]|nr:hypothetical protein [Methanothrix sp.]HPR66486.1 hypothetical protein [Methanothrix sp.]
MRDGRAEGARDSRRVGGRAAKTDDGRKGDGFAFELRKKIIKTPKAKDGCLQNLDSKLKFG